MNIYFVHIFIGVFLALTFLITSLSAYWTADLISGRDSRPIAKYSIALLALCLTADVALFVTILLTGLVS